MLTIQMLAMLVVALLIRFAGQNMYELDAWAVATCATFVGVALLCLVIISLQPMRLNAYHFQAPLVSVMATISMFGCILLVVMLEEAAMIRFVVWMAVGVPVYVAAKRRNRRQPKWPPNGISKIQSIHSRGFPAVEPAMPFAAASMVAATEAANTNQMVEIGSVDEAEKQLEAYVGPEMSDGHSNHENVIAMEHKSRTPSPSSSMDDIVLASDVINTLSERKEPNGKVYFVDELKSDPPSDDQVSDERSVDTVEMPASVEVMHTVAVIHGNTCDQSDVESISHETSGCVSQNIIEEPIAVDEQPTESIDAIVPYIEAITSLESEENQTQNLSENENMCSDKDPIQGSPVTVNVRTNILTHEDKIPTEIPLEYSEATEESNQVETISDPAATPNFISKTSMLQDEIPSETLLPKLNPHNLLSATDKPNPDKTISDPLSAPEVLSDYHNAIANIEAHLKNQESSDSDEEILPPSMFYHDGSASEEESTAPVSPTALEANSKDFKDRLSMLIFQNRPLNRQLSTTRKAVNESDEPTSHNINSDIRPAITSQDPDKLPDNSIPPPPLFDQELYNSMKGSPLYELPTPDYPDEERSFVSTKSDGKKTPASDDNSTSSDDEPPEQQMVSFRDKLESILKQGQPLRASMIDGMIRPVSIQKEEKPTAIELPVILIEPSEAPDNSVSIPETKTATPEPSPTANAHRALFRDVLKSINRQISQQSGEVVPRRTRKPATIEAARLSLRHVENAFV